MSKRYIKKNIRKWLLDWMNPGITVFVCRSSTVNNCGLVQKMWTVYVWPYGTPRCNGVTVEAIDYHDAIESAMDAVADRHQTWFKYYRP